MYKRAARADASQFRGQLDPLSFAAAERGALLAQRDVPQSHSLEGRGDAVNFGDGLEKVVGVVDRHGQHVGNAFASIPDLKVSRLNRLPLHDSQGT